MPINRSIPTLALLLALARAAPGQAQDVPGLAPTPAPASLAPPMAAPKLPPTEAEKAIDEAIRKVRALESVAADLTMDADMLGQSFTLKGQYFKAPGHRVYLRLGLEGLGEIAGTMLQICDGTTLWDFSKILDGQKCSKLAIGPVIKALDKPECDADFREMVLTKLGFAGPDALLAGLRKSCRFDQLAEKTLKVGQDEVAVFEIRGTWEDRNLNGPGQAPLPQATPLPPFVPSIVAVWIGREDGWPYQVSFEGRLPAMVPRAEREVDATGRPVGRQTTPSKEARRPTRLMLNYSNVQLNKALGPENFAFQPPEGVPAPDGTEKIVTELEQAIADRAAAKRNEAAKSATPTLDESLTAPAPLPGGAPPSAPLPR